MQDYTDDVIAFLEWIVGAPAYLFGYSLGGMIALMVAAQRSDLVRAVIVGDSPLSSESWRAVLDRSRDRLIAWRDLAGGQRPLNELVALLKESPIETRDGSMITMREMMGEDSPFFEWMAINLYHNDSAMYSALLDDFENTVVGYEMAVMLPAIRCPVLLLQADPSNDSAMPDAEVEQAMSLLAHPSHVRLDGVSHALQHTHPERVTQVIKDYLGSLE